MRTYNFSAGGISFEDPAAPSGAESLLAFLPAVSVVPLKQHSGSPSSPLVQVGDTIREGELLALAQGAGSADVHAPIPGEIVRMYRWPLSLTQNNDAFVIKFKGSFEILGKKTAQYPWNDTSPFALRALISKAGIVEMSGGDRPLQDRFAENFRQDHVRTLVVRCVFDDAWLGADLCLCRERAAVVAEGACIAARAAEAGRIIFAVSKNRREIGKILVAEAKNLNAVVEQVQVGFRYPQHGRRELEIALRKYEKKTQDPLGSLLFIGPAELVAIYDAVKLRKPLISRYVAVGGSAVTKPAIVEARIGMRIGELFQQCGGFKKEPERIGFGSALLGRRAASLDEPVDKTTFAVFAEAAPFFSLLKKIPFVQLRTSCINCGLCRTVCPVGLDPDGVYKRLTTSGIDEIYSRLIVECHGCACCEAVCPSRLPLCTVIKGLSNQKGISIEKELPSQKDHSIKKDLSRQKDHSSQKDLSIEKDLSRQKDLRGNPQ
jgi:electron transport complex protein RnfC